MENLTINIDKISGAVSRDTVFLHENDCKRNILSLENKTGAGNDFMGWLNLPSSTTEELLTDIESTSDKLSQKLDIMIVIGIGGSYLGAKSVIEALSGSFDFLKKKKHPQVLFAGQNIGEDYLVELLEVLKDKSFGITVISKSGTTTEPALAFRVLKHALEEKYGKAEAKNRIVAITDKAKGALKQLSDNEGYKTYIIPDDVGGRYSVLTPVGLVPIAVAGFDIRQLIAGAKQMETATGSDVPFENNPASVYAAARNALYKQGKKIEILSNFNPKLQYFAEWWKQLFGESEGKSGKGIFPASTNFTTDLHSMGQYIQDGPRHLFETIISVKSTDNELLIPEDEANLDKLNYLSGKKIDYVNKMAELGTTLAHVDGGVPVIKIEIPKLDEFYLGQLIYFFEKACPISAYMLNINPFDQEGVEAYKSNMFALLEKPGFEEATKLIKTKI